VRGWTAIASPEDMTAEPIIAWRTWNLAITPGRTRLVPVGDHRKPWRPRERSRAICGRHRFHRAPNPACTCGIHASKEIGLLQRTRGPSVLGTVALWGRVIEHELGYRGAFGYPQRLRLVCPVCFWQRGLDAELPTTVSVAPDGSATPLCEAHLATAERSGLALPGSRPAREVLGRLASAYAVDLLPEVRVSSSARRG
jgi:hypothetical protein